MSFCDFISTLHVFWFVAAVLHSPWMSLKRFFPPTNMHVMWECGVHEARDKIRKAKDAAAYNTWRVDDMGCCQTVLQVALGLRTAGRGCLSALRQPNPQMQAYAYGPSQLSHRDNLLVGDGWARSRHASSRKWLVSLRRGMKWLEKEWKMSTSHSLTCVYNQKNGFNEPLNH